MHEFPSTGFAQRAAAAQTRITRFRADLEALELRLEKVGRNTEALELAGKDPAVEIRRTRDDIAKVKIEVARSQESLQLIFSEERTRFAAIRQKVWEETCAETASSSVTKLAMAAAAVRSICTEVGLKSTKALDDGIAEVNRLVGVYRLPNNLGVPSTNGLTITLENALRGALASSGLAEAIEDLRVALRLDQPQPGTLTKAAQEFGRDRAGAR
jgi:hypothetical protein